MTSVKLNFCFARRLYFIWIFVTSLGGLIDSCRTFLQAHLPLAQEGRLLASTRGAAFVQLSVFVWISPLGLDLKLEAVTSIVQITTLRKDRTLPSPDLPLSGFPPVTHTDTPDLDACLFQFYPPCIFCPRPQHYVQPTPLILQVIWACICSAFLTSWTFLTLHIQSAQPSLKLSTRQSLNCPHSNVTSVFVGSTVHFPHPYHRATKPEVISLHCPEATEARTDYLTTSDRRQEVSKFSISAFLWLKIRPMCMRPAPLQRIFSQGLWD